MTTLARWDALRSDDAQSGGVVETNPNGGTMRHSWRQIHSAMPTSCLTWVQIVSEAETSHVEVNELPVIAAGYRCHPTDTDTRTYTHARTRAHTHTLSVSSFTHKHTHPPPPPPPHTNKQTNRKHTTSSIEISSHTDQSPSHAWPLQCVISLVHRRCCCHLTTSSHLCIPCRCHVTLRNVSPHHLC